VIKVEVQQHVWTALGDSAAGAAVLHHAKSKAPSSFGQCANNIHTLLTPDIGKMPTSCNIGYTLDL
jgi:hypothetical protein